MSAIHIERPVLNEKTPEANLAKVDTWISQTSDVLNFWIEKVEKEVAELKKTASGT